MWIVTALGGAWMPLSGAELKTAARHPMQYYVSLPDGWTSAKKWPVVVAIESANRDFAGNAEAFAAARAKMPFIIVTPLVVTNGGAGARSVASYHYADAVWDEIEREGPFKFDADGIAAVIEEVGRLYGGEDKYFLTGWEAGGHTVWAMIFQHPEALRAAAPVTFNYLGRWMSAGAFRSAPLLPVRMFRVEQSPSPLIAQIAEAKRTAEEHGFRNLSEEVVRKAHGPLAEEVLRWFASLL